MVHGHQIEHVCAHVDYMGQNNVSMVFCAAVPLVLITAPCTLYVC